MRRFGGFAKVRTGGRIGPIALLLCVALALASCSSGANTGGSSTGGGTGNAPTATPQPTKAPLTSLPPITVPYCQSLLSVAEANQIMSPAASYIDVAAESGESPVLGSCSYEYAPNAAHFQLFFVLWNGPVPISQQDISNAIAQSLSVNNRGGETISVTKYANVSGIGDQSAFVAVAATQDGAPAAKIDILYVLTGKVLLLCGNYFLGDQMPLAPPDATQQPELQQCGQTVVSRL